MNRIQEETLIHIEIIDCMEDAQTELHKRGWSVGHVGIDGEHQVNALKGESRIVAHAPTELDAWLLACVKVNDQERAWRHRN